VAVCSKESENYLAPFVAEGEKATGRLFEVLPVKPKVGGLRFYASQRTDAIPQGSEIGESESLRTCEVCGKPGKRREGDCIPTAAMTMLVCKAVTPLLVSR
jgi:hypothetical protein